MWELFQILLLCQKQVISYIYNWYIDVWIWWGAISFYSVIIYYKALINPTNFASPWSPESFAFGRNSFSSRPAFVKLRFPKSKPNNTFFFRSWRFYQHLPAEMSCQAPLPNIKGEVFLLEMVLQKKRVIPLAGRGCCCCCCCCCCCVFLKKSRLFHQSAVL